MLKYANSVQIGIKKVKLASYDGAWYTEHGSTTLVTIMSRILIEFGKFLVDHINI